MFQAILRKTVRHRVLGSTILRNLLTSIRAWNSIKSFTTSSNVGSGKKKILIRFTDLANVFSLFPHGLPVLEFGSGSSTIFFLAHPKVSSLVTFEEKPEYLPKLKMNQKAIWKVVVDDYFEEFVDSKRVTRFKNFEQFLNNPSLIYVDGPSTPVSSITNKTIPNTEVFSIKSIKQHIILIDGRLETVSLAVKHLRDSHFFFPSLAYRKSNPNCSNSFDQLPENFRKIIAGNVRTTAFIPTYFFLLK